MNKRKPITSAAQFFRVAPEKYKKTVKDAVQNRGYTTAGGHLGLSTHIFECYRIWVTTEACDELIAHYLKHKADI